MQKVNSITYNHLNLPKEIIFNTGNLIRYTYNAMGQKITKTVKTGAEFAVTDYRSGFQYRSSYTEAGGNQEEPRLQYFPTAEGYVEWLDGHPRYVYNYTDHLGNIRLSYAYDENVNMLRIIEENNYYPFGLKHQNYNNTRLKFEVIDDKVILHQVPFSVGDGKYNKKFGSKDWQEELGLNVYDFEARLYDPALVRTLIQDPLAEKFYNQSPYSFLNNNPLYFIDPTGMEPDEPDDWYRNDTTGEYVWYDVPYGEGLGVYNHTWVGKSLDDVKSDYDDSNILESLFFDPEFGNYGDIWPGEITQHDPDFWERQSEGNIVQNMGYDIANGFYTTSQLFMLRSVGDSSMRNLNGSATTTEQGVLGFASSYMFFLTGAGGQSVNATKGGVELTAHGAERIAGAAATRGGVLSMEGVNATKTLGRIFSQADGANVFLHEITPGRFNAVIQNQTTGKVITTMSNWSQKSINRIGKNYGWPIQ